MRNEKCEMRNVKTEDGNRTGPLGGTEKVKGREGNYKCEND